MSGDPGSLRPLSRMRSLVQPDAILFVISAPNLSNRRLVQLQTDSGAAAPVPSMLVRLEGAATSLPDALDSLFTAGHRRVLVQPLGMPITDSLLAWLPGAVATWRHDGHADTEIVIGREVGSSAQVVGE